MSEPLPCEIQGAFFSLSANSDHVSLREIAWETGADMLQVIEALRYDSRIDVTPTIDGGFARRNDGFQ